MFYDPFSKQLQSENDNLFPEVKPEDASGFPGTDLKDINNDTHIQGGVADAAEDSWRYTSAVGDNLIEGIRGEMGNESPEIAERIQKNKAIIAGINARDETRHGLINWVAKHNAMILTSLPTLGLGSIAEAPIKFAASQLAEKWAEKGVAEKSIQIAADYANAMKAGSEEAAEKAALTRDQELQSLQTKILRKKQMAHTGVGVVSGAIGGASWMLPDAIGTNLYVDKDGEVRLDRQAAAVETGMGVLMGGALVGGGHLFTFLKDAKAAKKNKALPFDKTESIPEEEGAAGTQEEASETDDQSSPSIEEQTESIRADLDHQVKTGHPPDPVVEGRMAMGPEITKELNKQFGSLDEINEPDNEHNGDRLAAKLHIFGLNINGNIVSTQKIEGKIMIRQVGQQLVDESKLRGQNKFLTTQLIKKDLKTFNKEERDQINTIINKHFRVIPYRNKGEALAESLGKAGEEPVEGQGTHNFIYEFGKSSNNKGTSLDLDHDLVPLLNHEKPEIQRVGYALKRLDRLSDQRVSDLNHESWGRALIDASSRNMNKEKAQEIINMTDKKYATHLASHAGEEVVKKAREALIEEIHKDSPVKKATDKTSNRYTRLIENLKAKKGENYLTCLLESSV